MSAMKLNVQGRAAYAYTGGKRFDATLPVVVFVHGALHDHSVWTLLARYFAHHGRGVLAVDLPGHGRSAGPALDDVEALGDWINALLDTAGVTADGAVSLVGHSMGSLIALEAAARRPARIARLAMVGTAWPMKVSDALLATSRERPRAAMAMVNAFSHATTAGKPAMPSLRTSNTLSRMPTITMPARRIVVVANLRPGLSDEGSGSALRSSRPMTIATGTPESGLLPVKPCDARIP